MRKLIAIGINDQIELVTETQSIRATFHRNSGEEDVWNLTLDEWRNLTYAVNKLIAEKRKADAE